MKKCVILGSVPLTNNALLQKYCKDCFLICADGGLDTAVKYGLKADLIVGDFDSAKTKPPAEIETIRLPVHKDDTDTSFAIKEGFRRGFQEFVLLGVLGGERFDHSYASLCNLLYIQKNGGNGLIAGDRCEIRIMTHGQLTLDGYRGCGLSVFPFAGPSCTVTYGGLEYPLDHYSLLSEFPMGVSNSVTEDQAVITLHQGSALVIVEFS